MNNLNLFDLNPVNRFHQFPFEQEKGKNTNVYLLQA